MSGLLITIEGVEGSGKSTQSRFLAQWLRGLGHQVRETREPEGTALGIGVRGLFGQAGPPPAPLAELFLFLAARHQHVAEVIRPALGRGEIVLSDRYTDASVAYQGYGRGLDLQTIRELNALVTGGVQPDLTLLLDLDAALGLERLGGRELDAFEKMALPFHQRVRHGYLEIAREEKNRVVVLDADQPRERLQEEIQKVMGDLLRQRGLAHGV